MNSIDPISLILQIPPFLLAITFHEFSHGWIAYKLGDPTAKNEGRLSFNPIVHIDPIGTILIPIILALTSPYMFGWAKPVPVNPLNFNNRNYRQGMMWTALAGPVSNLILAIVFALLIRIIYILPTNPNSQVLESLIYLLFYGVSINLALCLFNFIPIYPLDGQKILSGLLPEQYVDEFEKFNTFGPFLLIGLITIGRNYILAPIFTIWFRFFFRLAGL